MAVQAKLFLMGVSDVVGSAGTYQWYIALFTAHDLTLCTAMFLKISFSCKFHCPHTTTDGGASKQVRNKEQAPFPPYGLKIFE